MKVALIMLAAGCSRRFGSNKLLYPIDGKPMYLHLLERLSALCAGHPEWQLLVVSQYQEILEQAGRMAQERQEALNMKTGQVQAVCSPDSTLGISYSIKAGLSRAGDADAYVFFAADQPYLRQETIENFVTAMEQSGKKLGCVCHGSQRGNPVWFDCCYRDELMALEGDQGGKKVFGRHLGEAYDYEIEDAVQLQDIDCL